MSIAAAAKCPPDEKILADIEKAGIRAVEIYTNADSLREVGKVKQVCRKFPFRYALHLPNDGFEMDSLAEIADEIQADIVVLHNIYLEEEWEDIIKTFNGIRTQLTVENTFSALEPLKFIRRYGIGMCLDMEHIQIECAGYFEEGFLPFIRKAKHIHLTGYTYGSKLWHTHIHHSPEHNIRLLNLLKKADYSGFVVSEARASLQTLSEFKRLNEFIQKWLSGG